MPQLESDLADEHQHKISSAFNSGVGAVMLIASFLSLRHREAALESALSDELRAHDVTLQIALEENYQSGRTADAQRLVDLLPENSRVYGVFLFDENSDLRSLSQAVTVRNFASRLS